MMLNVFQTDAFSFTEMVAAINRIPYVPTRLGALGLFATEGVSTLTVAIEMQDGVLTLVPTQPRGAPGVVKNLQRRNIRDFRMVHLPQRVDVMADEVQNLRAFGSATDEETAMGLLTKKMAVATRDLTLTHEYQRMGCLKGVVLDADGTVIYNYFNEFNVVQQTQAWALSVATTKPIQLALTLKRMIEDTLGAVMNTGIRVLCSREFFDAFTNHPAVIDTYKYQMGQFLRADNRDGFEFAGITWEEYRGTVNGQRFIAANEAYAFAEGVPDLFKTIFAPAPYMETVNTIGLPFYAKQRNFDYDLGIEIQVQSNPLHIVTRPDSVIKLTAS